MYDAVLFDLDGTLVDTESIALATGLAAYAAHGLTVERSFLEGLIGKDDPTARRIAQEAFPDADLQAVSLTHRTAFAKAIEQGLPLKPGATQLLQSLSHPKGLVTSTGREGAHRKLGLAGIAAHFARVVTLDDVTRPKPAPEPYLLAATVHGGEPARCMVFEDRETGAEAAHRAGCIVVQVPDILPSRGRWAHHLAPDLLTGARMARLI